MNGFGDVVRGLMEKKAISGVQLAADIGISTTSVSKLLKGHSKPRQNTFTRMCQILCESKEDEQRLVSAFLGTEFMPEDSFEGKNEDSEKEVLRLRAEQFLERKTQAISFKRTVAKELDKAGIEYKTDYCEGLYSTDFLFQIGNERIALECKANVERDTKKIIAVSELLMQELDCRVLVVTPYITGIRELSSTKGVKLFPLSELSNYLK